MVDAQHAPTPSTSAVPLPSLADLLLSTSSSLLSLQSASSISQPSAQTYLAQLLAKSLEELRAEPETLASSSRQLDADLSHLCFRSYPTFLLSRSAATSIESSFSAFSDSLDSLVSSADGLGTACASFASLVSPLQAQRTQTLHVLEQVDKVAEVIDLPRLVGTCVRSGGYWNEALDLAGRADELCARAPDNAVLRRVKRDVEREIVGLEARIIEALRERSLKLPGAARSINLLKRIRKRGKRDTSPEEAEIRLAQILLCARWECLRSQLDQLQSGLYVGDDRVRHIKRWIELWREVIGETTSIYNDIFLVGQIISDPRLVQALRAFLQHALSSLLNALDTHLPHIASTAALASILTQLAYAGQAFARTHGLDFRALIALKIEARVQAYISTKMAEATAALRTELSRKTVTRTEWPSMPTALESFSTSPPSELTAIPVLARLLNGHATALNELRLLPALTIRPVLATAQAKELSEAADICAAVSPAEDAQSMLVWLGRVLAPWCERALRIGVYGDVDGREHPEVTKMRERCEPPKPAATEEAANANGAPISEDVERSSEEILAEPPKAVDPDEVPS